MRAYVITTGIAFGLLALVHVARIVAERGSLAREPFFMVITLLSAALCVWAVALLRRAKA